MADRIVSSAHLVSDKAAELSEVEYGLIVASNAFGLWAVRGTAAAAADFPGIADLGVIDVMCLHSVNHRERAKKLADICFKLNIEDTHIVNYALKKLVKAGLVTSQKQGKEVFYETSDTGKAVIRRYRDIREACLVDAFSALGEVDPDSLGELARQLAKAVGIHLAKCGKGVDEAGLPNVPVTPDHRLAGITCLVEHFLALFLAGDKPCLDQLLQRVVHDMRVLDIQLETDIGQLLGAFPVVHRMKAHHVDHAKIGDPREIGRRRRRSANSPQAKGVAGDDQSVFDLAQLCRLVRNEMRR